MKDKEDPLEKPESEWGDGFTASFERDDESHNGVLSQIDPDPLFDSLWELFESFAAGMFLSFLLSEVQALRETAISATELLEESEEDWILEKEGREGVRAIALYFAFSGQATELLLREIAFKEVLSESAKTKNTENWMDNLGAHECLELLYASNVIDGDTKGRIGNAKKTRNKFMHDIESWFQPDDAAHLTAQIKRSDRAIRDLLEILQEGEAYDVEEFYGNE